MEENRWIHRDIVIAFIILTGFLFIASFTAFYVSEVLNKGHACGCVVPIPVLMLLLSSLGLFVGFLSYFFLSQRFMYIRKKDKVNAECTLNFLDNEERKIVRALIKSKKALKQSELDEITGFSRVKVFRALKRLESKGIIERTDIGRTFQIKLKKCYEDVFFC